METQAEILTCLKSKINKCLEKKQKKCDETKVEINTST